MLDTNGKEITTREWIDFLIGIICYCFACPGLVIGTLAITGSFESLSPWIVAINTNDVYASLVLIVSVILSGMSYHYLTKNLKK